MNDNQTVPHTHIFRYHSGTFGAVTDYCIHCGLLKTTLLRPWGITPRTRENARARRKTTAKLSRREKAAVRDSVKAITARARAKSE